MEYQSELINGFQSIFYFKCKVCNIVEKLYTENIKNTNKASVSACQAIYSYRFVLVLVLIYRLMTCVF